MTDPSIEVALALEAISGGFPYRLEDGHIVVENPNFREDDGSNPNLVIELASSFGEQNVDGVRGMLRKIALTPIWQDHYHDGPDMMAGKLELTPDDVRFARGCVGHPTALEAMAS